MNVAESKILKTMVKTYQNELDDILEDYNLIGAVLCLLKAHHAPEDGETVRLLCRRQNKIVDKMKAIQENLDKAQEELKAIEEEEKMTEQAPCCIPLEQPKKLRRIDILQSMTADALASFLSEIASCCMAVGYYSNPDIECCQLARCPFAEGLTDINECSVERIKRWLEEEIKEEEE